MNKYWSFFIKINLYYINMSGFYYETLTINGITKICDNNIYINNERTVINYQWHKFQLKYIIEHI